MCQQRSIFVSYSHKDAQIATELASRLEDAGLPCFLAERDISATQQWEPRLRDEIRYSRCILLLLTPRSRNSTWVSIEAGAAWVLEKELFPATMFVEADDLSEPIRRYQIRPVETNAQITTLIQELQRKLLPQLPSSTPNQASSLVTSITSQRELFNERGTWDRLQKIGEWQLDDNSHVFQGKGEHSYLLSHFTYGRHAFHVNARLRFTSLQPLNDIAAVNAGIVFGWRAVGDVRRYYNLMFTRQRLLLEVVGARGGPVFSDFQHIDEGVPFVLESGRFYDLEVSLLNRQLTVRIDKAQTYSVNIEDDARGRVGIRPWRSRVESDQFEVEETQ